MNIRTLVLMVAVFNTVHAHAWFGALVCAPRLVGSALGCAAKGAGKTGLWALQHPFFTLGMACAAMYVDKNLRDTCYGATRYLFDTYRRWSPDSKLVQAVDCASSVYHFFNPTQQERLEKEAEKKQAEQKAQALEEQVAAQQERNAALAQQLKVVVGQVNTLNEQLAVARNTQAAMTELSHRFELLTINCTSMAQQLGSNETGLVGTMNNINQELRQLAGKVDGLGGDVNQRIQTCLCNVQQLLARADAVRVNEFKRLDDSVQENLKVGAQNILNQVRELVRAGVLSAATV